MTKKQELEQLARRFRQQAQETQLPGYAQLLLRAAREIDGYIKAPAGSAPNSSETSSTPP